MRDAESRGLCCLLWLAKKARQNPRLLVTTGWLGTVAWQVAFALPQMVENPVILNLSHHNGVAREMAGNEEQQLLCETFYLGQFRRSEYSRQLPYDSRNLG